jgi:hypothetical protein
VSAAYSPVRRGGPRLTPQRQLGDDHPVVGVRGDHDAGGERLEALIHPDEVDAFDGEVRGDRVRPAMTGGPECVGQAGGLQRPEERIALAGVEVTTDDHRQVAVAVALGQQVLDRAHA